MGKAMFFIIVGFTLTFGTVRYNLQKANERSLDTTVNTFADKTRINTAMSGLNIALSKLTINPSWRAGLDSTDFNGGQFMVTVIDTVNVDLENIIRLTSTGMYSDTNKVLQVDVSTNSLLGMKAIYSTGDVDNVTSLDEYRNPDN